MRLAYTPVKNWPKNVGIATEIASISVFVPKLLVLPVWGTVSTSGLYLKSSQVKFIFSIAE